MVSFFCCTRANLLDPNFFGDPSGCTAVVALFTPDGRIIVANAGDSRAVLGYKGEGKAMSNDHKPTNKEETARITTAGGFVEFGRVNGMFSFGLIHVSYLTSRQPCSLARYR
jgi:serine/threonine protein phosphatase PrpC